MLQSTLRQPLESVQQGLQFAVLLRGGPVEGSGLRSELHIDGFAFGLIGPLKIRSVAPGRVEAAGAAGLTALHPPPEDGSLAEVLER